MVCLLPHFKAKHIIVNSRISRIMNPLKIDLICSVCEETMIIYVRRTIFELLRWEV